MEQDFAKAIEFFTLALQGAEARSTGAEGNEQTRAWILRNRALVHLARKKFDDCSQDARAAVALEPNAKGFYLLGRGQFGAGKCVFSLSMIQEIPASPYSCSNFHFVLLNHYFVQAQ